MTETGDLTRLRRAAAAGLRRAASSFDDAVAGTEKLAVRVPSTQAAQRPAAPDTADAPGSARLSPDNELALQELANLLLPYIENALRNRRDIGAP